MVAYAVITRNQTTKDETNKVDKTLNLQQDDMR